MTEFEVSVYGEWDILIENEKGEDIVKTLDCTEFGSIFAELTAGVPVDKLTDEKGFSFDFFGESLRFIHLVNKKVAEATADEMCDKKTRKRV